MIWLYIIIFIISFFILFFASKFLVSAIMEVAKFLGWKEFVVAFFIMSFATSIPNFSIGIISALNNMPEISFGDIVGGNIVDLSLVLGLIALLSKSDLCTPSRIVQSSSIFTIAIALLPLILIQDKVLSRADGFILFVIFLFYIYWLFNKKERFKKIYDGVSKIPSLKVIFKNIILIFISIPLLMIAAEGIIRSSIYIAGYLNLPISLISILVIGLGNCLPEIFFTIQSARKNCDWLIFGNLMGSIVITSTLVLGVVSFINPIRIKDFSPFLIARFFLIVSAIFFFLFIRTDRKITKIEGLFLIGIYIVFVLVEIFTG